MQKEWKLYVKKILLNKLYDENTNEKVINFLKNYDLLKVNVLNNDGHELEIDILFSHKNETVTINGGFLVRDWRIYYNWAIPKEFAIMELEEIIDMFRFPSYFVDGEI